MERLAIDLFLLRAKDTAIVDVRTPAEYRYAHIPGAVNIPLFSNIERAVVGTAYKKEGKKKAIFRALDMAGEKLRRIAEQADKLSHNGHVCIYCWRGGMRSGSVAWLLELCGLKVSVLEGGYKSFRNYVLSSFEEKYNIQILSGKTGAGKTKVLKALQSQGQAVLDLEGLSSHKGSAFGALGEKKQPTTEQFENMIAMSLRSTAEKKIWIEDESRCIGRCVIPGKLWDQMRAAPVFVLDIPFDARLDNLLSDYGSFSRSDLIRSMGKISERLGGVRFQEAVAALKKGDLRTAASISLDYYDKAYLHGLAKRTESKIDWIDCADLIGDFSRIAQIVASR